MKQLITRVDDELHARLKARAVAEGRSLNDLVTEVLAAAVGHRLTRLVVETRAQAAGLLVRPPRPQTQVSREQAPQATRGTGSAVSDALETERRER